MEATSFTPVLKDSDTPWKEGALSFYDRRNPDGEGHSIRGDRYRYTEWRDYETGEVLARELYDHADGPVAGANLADDPAHAADVERLSGLLAGGWEKLVPSAAPKLKDAPSTKPAPVAEPTGGSATSENGDEEEDGEEGSTTSRSSGSFPAEPDGTLLFDGFTQDGDHGGGFADDSTSGSVTVGGVELTAEASAGRVFQISGGGTGVTKKGDRKDYDLNPGESFTLRFDAPGTITGVGLLARGGGKNQNLGRNGLLRLTRTDTGEALELAFEPPARGPEDLELDASLAFEAGVPIRVEAAGDALCRLRSLRIEPDAAD